jgi:DNA modification methylase
MSEPNGETPLLSLQGTTFLDGRVTQYVGDVRAVLKSLPADHFDCVVTSPPYWGLRDYGTGRWEGGDPDCEHRSPTMREGRNEDRTKLDGSAATNSAQNILAHNSSCGKCGAIKIDEQIGLESTLGEHLAVMVDTFEEVRRVLKPTGTLWLNYGDCYATAPNGRSAADTKAKGNDDRTFRDKPFSTVGAIYDPTGGIKGGGYRGDNKGNPRSPGGRVVAGAVLKAKDLCMVPNRLAIALQEAGWWVRSEIIWHKPNPMPESIKDRPGTSHEKVWLLSKRERYFYDADAVAEPLASSSVWRLAQDIESQTGSFRANGGLKTNGTMKAVGGAKPHSKEYGRKIIDNDSDLAADGTSGAGFAPRDAGRNLRNVWTIPTAAFSEAHFATFPPGLVDRCIKAGSPAGGSILDPFGGSGTTGLVAARLGRTATLIDLNPEYAILARARIEADFMGRDEGARHMVKQLGKAVDPGPLFGGPISSEGI